MIYAGSVPIKAVYYGSRTVDELWLGASRVWSANRVHGQGYAVLLLDGALIGAPASCVAGILSGRLGMDAVSAAEATPAVSGTPYGCGAIDLYMDAETTGVDAGQAVCAAAISAPTTAYTYRAVAPLVILQAAVAVKTGGASGVGHSREIAAQPELDISAEATEGVGHSREIAAQPELDISAEAVSGAGVQREVSQQLLCTAEAAAEQAGTEDAESASVSGIDGAMTAKTTGVQPSGWTADAALESGAEAKAVVSPVQGESTSEVAVQLFGTAETASAAVSESMADAAVACAATGGNAASAEAATLAGLEVSSACQAEANTPSAWEYPVQVGDTLYITQIYSATQNGSTLEVE